MSGYDHYVDIQWPLRNAVWEHSCECIVVKFPNNARRRDRRDTKFVEQRGGRGFVSRDVREGHGQQRRARQRYRVRRSPVGERQKSISFLPPLPVVALLYYASSQELVRLRER